MYFLVHFIVCLCFSSLPISVRRCLVVCARCFSQSDSVGPNEARLPAISAAQPYLPERAGWTLGQGTEVIRQGVVVNDGVPCTPGLKPPAALCAVKPTQKDWWGGRLTFRPGTHFQGCLQKTCWAVGGSAFPTRSPYTPLEHYPMHMLLLNFRNLPTPKLLGESLWTEEWIQIRHHHLASTTGKVFLSLCFSSGFLFQFFTLLLSFHNMLCWHMSISKWHMSTLCPWLYGKSYTV